jgi:hypothetical protein
MWLCTAYKRVSLEIIQVPAKFQPNLWGQGLLRELTASLGLQ